jgi:uncharacterized Tic20 family protein
MTDPNAPIGPPPPGGPDPLPYQTPTHPPPSNDDRNLGLLTHVLGILTSVLGPLIIWLSKRETSPYVDDQGKEALNFQLTLLLGFFIATLISMVTCGVGAVLYIPLVVIDVVFGILAAVASSRGEYYRYPVSIRLVK